MREYKFRAWLPGIKKMTYPHTLEELMNWNTKPEDNGTAIWMQYTGLENAYEDDILEITSSVSGNKYRYLIEWETENARFMAVPINGALRKMVSASIERGGVVIGNRWEHPHLLEPNP